MQYIDKNIQFEIVSQLMPEFKDDNYSKIVGINKQGFYIIKGFIVKELRNITVYEACTNCHKKVDNCSCDMRETTEYRMILNLIIDDGSGTIRTFLMGDNAEKLLGITTEKIVQIKDTPDFQKFLEKISSELLGKDIIIRGKAKFSDYSNSYELIVFEFHGLDDMFELHEKEKKRAKENKLKSSQLNVLEDFKKLVLHFEPVINEENGNIVELFFWQNGINNLPDSIGELTSLRRLTLGMNHLVDLPESFTNLQNLKELYLDINDFTSIPSQILLIKSLKTLDMSANKLEDVPKQIENMDSLEFLDLSINYKLKQLPESLGNLKNLKILNVEQCYDLEIPENIRLKKNLTIRGIDDLQRDKYGNININLLIRDFGTPPVIYYAEEDMHEKVIDKDKLVILDDIIRIKYSYPLHKPVEIEFEKKGGFTRLDLYGCIYEGYRTIYEEEEEVAGDPGTYKFVMNRKPSDGPYGIWGHYLGELFLEGISYNPKTKVVSLTIGS